MTPLEFRAALKLLGMTPGSYARASGRNVNTVDNWAKTRAIRVPEPVVEWLRRQVKLREKDPPP